MGKKLRLGLIVGATTMLVAVGNCWANASERGRENGRGNELNRQSPPVYAPERGRENGRENGRGNELNRQPPRVHAPEIDAGAGSGALALLIGGLLLAAEKRRRCS